VVRQWQATGHPMDFQQTEIPVTVINCGIFSPQKSSFQRSSKRIASIP
jgi:hypothetical protein